MQIAIKAAFFKVPIRTYKGRNIMSANPLNPDTRDWQLKLLKGHLVCTEPSGKQHLVFQSNISSLQVEVIESAG